MADESINRWNCTCNHLILNLKKLKFIFIGGVLLLLFFTPASHKAENKNDFDYLIFTQRWLISACISYMDNNPSLHRHCILPKNYKIWAIHGVWPQKGHHPDPLYCNSSAVFNLDSIKPLIKDLLLYWPNIQEAGNSSLWRHEWEKHGTCAMSLESLNDEYKYFGESLRLYKEFNISDCLYKENILPSNKGVSPENLLYVFKKNFGKNVKVHCITDVITQQAYLSEVQFCLNKDLRLIDCDATKSDAWRSYKFGLGQLTNCPLDSLVLYPDTINNSQIHISSNERHIRYYFQLFDILKLIRFLQWVFL